MTPIEEFAQRIEEKCKEIRLKFEETYSVLPFDLRKRIAENLERIYVMQGGYYHLHIGDLWPAIISDSRNGEKIALIIRRVDAESNFLQYGFIVFRNGTEYCIGSLCLHNNAGRLLDGELKPEDTLMQIIQLLDTWFSAFSRSLDERLRANPIVREMFDTVLSMRCCYVESLAEQERLKKELENKNGELDAIIGKVRGAAQKLLATKGFVRSKAIRAIREDLERMIPKDNSDVYLVPPRRVDPLLRHRVPHP